MKPREQMAEGEDSEGLPAVRHKPELGAPERLEAARVSAAIRRRLFGAAVSAPTLEHFQLTKRLGAGAMGVVFLARDTALERDVALKIVRPRSAAEHSERSHQRLLREARAMAKLRHPNVVTVFEVGIVDDQAFIAMEYVQGMNLREWLAAEPRTWKHVRDVFVDAGRGIAAAHAAGLVHRDFKPDNVLIGSDGHVQVTDFGVARPVRDETLESHQTTGQHPGPLTDHLRAGTPCYMAPEQWAGEKVDARSDQFAFCAALFEALFGNLPFEGSTDAVFEQNVRAGRIRRPDASQRVPRWLHDAVVKGLRPKADERHPSMEALIDALQPKRQTWIWLLAGLLLTAIGGGTLALVAGRHPHTAPVASSQASAPPPVATSVASVVQPVAPLELGSIPIPAGVSKNDTWLPSYSVVHHLGDEGTDILAALAQCRSQGLALCTDAQWMRACEVDARLASVETWTATAAADRGFVVRGGRGVCRDRRVVPGAQHDPTRTVVCCSRAVGITTDGRNQALPAIAAETLVRLESVLSEVNVTRLAKMTDKRIIYLGRPLSRERWLVELRQSLAHQPTQWLLHDVCAARLVARQGEQSWSADCRTLSRAGGKLSYTNRRYAFGGPSGKLQGITETAVFRHLSTPE